MSPIRSRTVVLALAVLVPLGLVEAAPAAASPRRHAPGRPSPQAASPLGYRASLARLARGGGSPADVIRDALLALAPAGARGRSFHSPVPLGVDAFAEAAGDLDGDGNEDALEHAFRYGFEPTTGAFTLETTLTALRGTDGATLWARPAEGPGFGIALGDLDGAPGADILLFELLEQFLPTAYVFELRVTGVRGTDGGALWTRSYTSAVSTGPDGGGGLDLTIPIDDRRDLDGDGALDVLLVRYQSSGFADPSTGVAESPVTSTIEAISGRTGTTITTVTPDPAPGFADPVTVPDLTGDGVADLAVLEGGSEAPDGTVVRPLAAHPGVGGPAVWRVLVALPQAMAIPRGAELNGDKVGDVLLEIVAGDPLIFFSSQPPPTPVPFLPGGMHLRAYTGAGGAQLWASQEFPLFSAALLAGDATGDGGQDVLVHVEGFLFPFFGKKKPKKPGQPDAFLVRGSDGGVAWSRDIPDVEYTFPAGDLDGDGVEDLLADSFRFKKVKKEDPNTGKIEKHFKTRQLTRAISGRDGAVFWKLNTGHGKRYVVPAGGDLDGDGADDLVLFRRIVKKQKDEPVPPPLAGTKKGKKKKGKRLLLLSAVAGHTRQPLWPGTRRVSGMVIGGFDVLARAGGGGNLLDWGWTPHFGAALNGLRSGADGLRLWLRTITP